MVTVNNLKILKKIKNHKDGEVFFVKEENAGYVWNDALNDYIKVDKNLAGKGGLSMNLYEINKSIISQMDPLDDDRLNELKNTVNTLMTEDYYLLYGKELSYFTLFQKKDDLEESLGEALLDCLKVFKKIYSFEVIEDTKSIEIWVYNEETNLASVLYLFNYKDGVVFYG